MEQITSFLALWAIERQRLVLQTMLDEARVISLLSASNELFAE
jgi:hypothetical protein